MNKCAYIRARWYNAKNDYMTVELSDPYLIVSLADWALGIQCEPDSPISHGTLPGPQENPTATGRGVVAGKSSTDRGTDDYDPGCKYHEPHLPSITVSPPDEGAVMADVDSFKSQDISAQSQAEPVIVEEMDITSAPLLSALMPVEPPVLRIDISCVLHPFYNHSSTRGPLDF